MIFIDFVERGEEEEVSEGEERVRERRAVRERNIHGREKHQSVAFCICLHQFPPIYALTGHQTLNLSMYPDLKSHSQHFLVSGMMLQLTEPPG